MTIIREYDPPICFFTGIAKQMAEKTDKKHGIIVGLIYNEYLTHKSIVERWPENEKFLENNYVPDFPQRCDYLLEGLFERVDILTAILAMIQFGIFDEKIVYFDPKEHE